MNNINCSNCFHDIGLHTNDHGCVFPSCECFKEFQVKKPTERKLASPGLCEQCFHMCNEHAVTGCTFKSFEGLTCTCKKIFSVNSDKVVLNQNSISLQKNNEVTHQNLEPNTVKIFTKGDVIDFSIQRSHFDLDTCIDEVVEGYNKLAKALGKKIIGLNQIIGAPVEEEFKSFEDKYNINKEEFEIKCLKTKTKDRNLKTFHNRLRMYREKKDISIIAFCEKLDFDPNIYLQIERGIIKPSFNEDQLLIISDILHLDDTRYKRLLEGLQK